MADTRLTFSELIAPQGRGLGASAPKGIDNILAKDLWAPAKREAGPEIITPIFPTWKVAVDGQPKPIVRIKMPAHNQFDKPTTTVLHGDGSDSAFWYNLPNPTRLRSKQIIKGGVKSEDDFLITDGEFELVIGFVGQLDVRLDADGYDQQHVIFTALAPVV